MRGSLIIGKFAGIKVGIHWSFLILIGFIFLQASLSNWSSSQTLFFTGLLLAVFLCVLLHEFGHSLAAKRYGINTQDITILPIGGLARLERMPEDPWQELIVALAGPAVNLIIAFAIFSGLSLRGEAPGFNDFSLTNSGFWSNLMIANASLLVFNLIPAFPMDGGRVLRALLGFWLTRVKATAIAARAGQFFGFIFLIYGGWTFQPFLMIIGYFIMSGAGQEFEMVRSKDVMSKYKASDCMITHFRVLSVWDTVQEALEELQRGESNEFVVVNEAQVAGLLPGKRIVKAVAEGRNEELVCRIMEKNFPLLSGEESLDEVVAKMEESNVPILPITKEGTLVGIMTFSKIQEFLQMQDFVASRKMKSKILKTKPQE